MYIPSDYELKNARAKFLQYLRFVGKLLNHQMSLDISLRDRQFENIMRNITRYEAKVRSRCGKPYDHNLVVTIPSDKKEQIYIDRVIQKFYDVYVEQIKNFKSDIEFFKNRIYRKAGKANMVEQKPKVEHREKKYLLSIYYISGPYDATTDNQVFETIDQARAYVKWYVNQFDKYGVIRKHKGSFEHFEYRISHEDDGLIESRFITKKEELI